MYYLHIKFTFQYINYYFFISRQHNTIYSYSGQIIQLMYFGYITKLILITKLRKNIKIVYIE